MLNKKDIAMLRVLDGASHKNGWLPVESVLSKVVWSPLKLKPRIRQLEREGLVAWKTDFGSTSLRLTDRGRDALSVWDFHRHGLLEDIGNVIAVGKESVIVNARGPEGEFVIKFHRYDSAVFAKVKRSLAFMAIDLRMPFDSQSDISRLKARIEYDTLSALHGKVNVPEVFGINRHAIAMQMLGDTFPAPLLKDVPIKDGMREQVFAQYQLAVDAGYVHGDMSEYNVMLFGNDFYLIDWPQAVPSSCEHASILESRDREKLDSFFSKFENREK